MADNGGVANLGLNYDAIPSLSGDGRYLSFGSDGTNLVFQDVLGFANIYARDTCAGASSCTPHTTLVSLGNDGTVANSRQS